MSQSNIPVVSQVAGFLSPQTPAIQAAPTTPNPATDPQTALDMQESEEEQDKAKGEAANFLTSGGAAGVSGSSSTSRSVLLGS